MIQNQENLHQINENDLLIVAKEWKKQCKTFGKNIITHYKYFWYPQIAKNTNIDLKKVIIIIESNFYYCSQQEAEKFLNEFAEFKNITLNTDVFPMNTYHAYDLLYNKIATPENELFDHILYYASIDPVCSHNLLAKKIIKKEDKYFDNILYSAIQSPICAYYLIFNELIKKEDKYFDDTLYEAMSDPIYAFYLILEGTITEKEIWFNDILSKVINKPIYCYYLISEEVITQKDECFQNLLDSIKSNSYLYNMLLGKNIPDVKLSLEKESTNNKEIVGENDLSYDHLDSE